MPEKTHPPVLPLEDVAFAGATPEIDPPKQVVLIVDENQAVADGLAVVLAQDGYTAMVAYDGGAALEMARIISPDLLLADAATPCLNGVELATAIRRFHPQCSILLFSGDGSIDGRMTTTRTLDGPFTLLSKSLSSKELLEQILDTLQSPDEIGEKSSRSNHRRNSGE